MLKRAGQMGLEEARREVRRLRERETRSREMWILAAEKALAGDAKDLRLRIELARSGKIDFTETEQ